MTDGVESIPRSPARRRPHQKRTKGGTVSVADLLARCAVADGDPPDGRADAEQPDDGLPSPRASTAADPGQPPASETTNQLILGGAPPGHASTDQFLLDPLFGPLPGRSPEPDDGGPDDGPTDLVPRIAEPKSGTSRDGDGPGDDATDTSASSSGAEEAEEPAGNDLVLRTRRIDESLVRLTAIHAGLGAGVTARVSASSRLPVVGRTGEPPDDPPGGPVAADGGAERPSALTVLGRVALALVAVLLFVAVGAGWGTKSSLDGKLRRVNALDPGAETIVDRAGQAGDENYLLIGSDSRSGFDSGGGDADRADGEDAGGEDAGASFRSDTVTVAHIPAKRDHVVLLSFPRTLRVDRPNCDRWDQASASYPGGTVLAANDVQLTSAFEMGGPRCVTKVVQQLTGLSINHFVALDIAGFKDMVDAVQGVPICIAHPVVDSVLGRVVSSTGPTVLAGDQAVALVRARHVYGDRTSESGRIQRQQRFLSALLRKGLSTEVMLSLAKLRAFVAAFVGHALTDNTGLDELATLGGSVRNVDPAKVTFATLPTQGDPTRGGDELLRKDQADALFTAIRSEQPLPGEAVAGDDRAGAAGASGAEVALAVRNGSSRTGLANEVANNLRSVGFTISRIGDADPVVDGRTLVRHSPDRAEQANKVTSAVPDAVAQEAPGPAGMLELVLGENFDGKVKAPVSVNTAPGTDPAAHDTIDGGDAACR